MQSSVTANDRNVILETIKLKKSFESDVHGKVEVLRGINFALRESEVTSIIGPSGCGKSTFLRCLNGLESVSSGDIIFEGMKLDPGINWRTIRRKIGMVFQNYELFPHFSVLENIILAPMKILHTSKESAVHTAMQWLSRVGLEGKAHSFPKDLSGGQKQRVAIIRSLCMNPAVMLFDEVTASLDPEMVKEVLDVIKSLAYDGMSMIIVTHQMRFAEVISDRVVFFDNGVIAHESNARDFFSNPGSERIAQFLNVFDF